MKQSLLFIFTLIISFPLFAQYQISGQVFSSEKKPIEFATVMVYPLADSTDIRGVITNGIDGKFTLENMEAGNYQLIIQMLGYEDLEKVIKVAANVDVGVLLLIEESMMLKGIEVVAERSTLESRLGKKILRIGQDLSATGSNALEALETIPSITTTQRGQIQIRGSSNVVIYINGKETRRDPSTLKFVAAESLEKIEVITNPSAKHDAEGVAGIINLVYKKDKKAKFKLEAITNLTVPTNPFLLNPSGGLNLSLSRDKISFFTNISLDYGRYEDYFDSKRTNFNDSLEYYENHVTNKGLGLISNFNMGLSIEPDTTLSLGLEVNFDRWDLTDESFQNNIFTYQDASSQTVDFFNKRGELENELWINFSIEKELKRAHHLKLSLTTGGEDEDNFYQNNDLNSISIPSVVDQFLLNSDEQEKQRYYQGKLDFEAPFFNFGKMEIGAKADFIRYDILQKATLRSSTINVPNNDFTMDLQKLGIYVLQSHHFKKLEYALGIRMEQFSSEALQRSNQTTFPQKYLRFFPSVQLNYMLSDASHTIGFNYTRRINRPSFFDLNPFISYSDPLNLRTGNPALRPEIANLYEVSYHKGMDKASIDITLYRRETADAISATVKPFNNNQSIEIPVNFAQQVNQGIEGQLEYQVNDAIKTTASFVIGQVEYSDQETQITFNKNTSWNARLRQQFKLTNNWKIEFSETYRAPRFSAQRKSLENFYVNFAVNKKFNNKRGSIVLSVRDVFNTRQYGYILLSPNFELERIDKWQTRQITLGLRYFIFDGK